MKKLLGISLVAVLAATPLMAEAARDVAVVNYATPEASTTVASKSYVEGAYKAASDRIDDLVTDTDVTGEHNVIVAGDSVASNLGALDAAIGDTETFDGANVSAAISALQTSIGSGANALGGRVTALENTMGDTAITNDLSATTVTDAINELSDEKVDQAGNFTEASNSDLIENKTVVAAIQTTAAQVDLNTAAISAETSRAEGVEGNKNNLNTTDKTNLVSAINEVNTAVSNLSTTAGNTYQLKSESRVSATDAGNHALLTEGTGVAANLVSVAGAAEGNTAAITTINNKQIPIVTSWTNGTVVQKKISELVTYTEPATDEPNG